MNPNLRLRSPPSPAFPPPPQSMDPLVRGYVVNNTYTHVGCKKGHKTKASNPHVFLTLVCRNWIHPRSRYNITFTMINYDRSKGNESMCEPHGRGGEDKQRTTTESKESNRNETKRNEAILLNKNNRTAHLACSYKCSTEKSEYIQRKPQHHITSNVR